MKTSVELSTICSRHTYIFDSGVGHCVNQCLYIADTILDINTPTQFSHYVKHFFQNNALQVNAWDMIKIMAWGAMSVSWWSHNLETLSALVARCEGNHRWMVDSPHKGPMTLIFDVLFDVSLKQPLNKHSGFWLFETPWRSLWYYISISEQWRSGIMLLTHQTDVLAAAVSAGAVVALLICAVVLCCKRRAELDMRNKSRVIELSWPAAPIEICGGLPGEPAKNTHMWWLYRWVSARKT